MRTHFRDGPTGERDTIAWPQGSVYNGSRGQRSTPILMAEALQPLWFRLPKRFYRKLGMISESAGLAPEVCLEQALEILGRIVVAAHDENVGVQEFLSDLRPRVRAWKKEAGNQGIGLVDALGDGVKLFHMYGPIDASASDVDRAHVRKSPAALAIIRWAKVSPAERSAHARKLAEKRWGPKKKIARKVAGKKADHGDL